ncbi:MAG: hypothetical protein NUV46_01865 [Nanoarchaeota archaeon]|nr:hypothetical protein [Nanoarchaeota archaeon]
MKHKTILIIIIVVLFLIFTGIAELVVSMIMWIISFMISLGIILIFMIFGIGYAIYLILKKNPSNKEK